MKSAIIAAVIATVISATAATAATTLITGAQIKNGSISAVDLSAGAKRALKGQPGPAGPQGATGAQGPTGAQGATGVAGGFDPAKIHYVQSDMVQIDSDDPGHADAYCPAGEKAVSGGFFMNAVDTLLVQSRPVDSGDYWTVSVNNRSDHAYAQLTAYAVCVSP